MSEKVIPNSQQPAFPIMDSDGAVFPNEKGLTKFEWFVGQALPATLAHRMAEYRLPLDKREVWQRAWKGEQYEEVAIRDALGIAEDVMAAIEEFTEEEETQGE